MKFSTSLCVKTLIISTSGLHYEGMTMVIRNYTRAMDRTGLELHFIAYDDIAPGLRADFEELGTLRIVHRRKKDVKNYIKDLKSILKEGFDVVHIHGNSGTMALEAVMAKRFGVKNILVHCHNTTCDHPQLNKILNVPMLRCASYSLACSEAAGKYLYGKRSFIVLRNAIDIDKFRYDLSKRNEIRSELGIADDDFIIGHCGRISEEKNHTFLLDVFAQIQEARPDAMLVLAGGGKLEDKIREKIEELGLSDKVLLLGARSDVERIYQAFDIFIFPSLFEGLPVTIIEAQTSGLPCLVSEAVPEEAVLTDLVKRLPLSRSAEDWAKEALDMIEKSAPRRSRADEVAAAGYDIRTSAKELEEMYRGMVESTI